MSAPETPRDVDECVARALAEDLGPGDVTAALVPADAAIEAEVVSRESAVICGRPWFDAVFRQLDAGIGIRWHLDEGAAARPDTRVCTLSGRARPILSGERTALNFLQTLSGTATAVRRFVERVRGTQARIVDTRKTLPGLRSAQKYAVAAGGGENHRRGLYDAILIKENHIAAAGGLRAAIERARALKAGVPLMVEAENLSEAQIALDADVDLLLLDDFPTHLLVKAVHLAREYRHLHRAHALLEASGGVSLHNVRSIADTGVDRISIGGLTKHVQAVDLSLRVSVAASASADAGAPALRRARK